MRGDWRMWLAAGSGTILAAMAVVHWLRRPRDPEEPERLRRSHVSQVGRIAEGHIIEILDTPDAPQESRGALSLLGRRKPVAASNGHRTLVCYGYLISGVSYETAQDVTGLEARFPISRLVPGQPASVKYDPANPTNSILLSEDWSGLH
jgi:hypothetical protein